MSFGPTFFIFQISSKQKNIEIRKNIFQNFQESSDWSERFLRRPPIGHNLLAI